MSSVQSWYPMTPDLRCSPSPPERTNRVRGRMIQGSEVLENKWALYWERNSHVTKQRITMSPSVGKREGEWPHPDRGWFPTLYCLHYSSWFSQCNQWFRLARSSVGTTTGAFFPCNLFTWMKICISIGRLTSVRTKRLSRTGLYLQKKTALRIIWPSTKFRQPHYFIFQCCLWWNLHQSLIPKLCMGSSGKLHLDLGWHPDPAWNLCFTELVYPKFY